jgi:lambda family phage minor tail protein L
MDEFEKTSQQFELPAFIDLFDIDLTYIGRPEIFYFTPMVGEGNKLTWGGHDYVPFPIAIQSLEATTSGAPPRAELHIANVLDPRLFGSLAFLYNDLVGTRVTYRRTFSTLLNTSISSAALKFVINKKISQNKTGIVFEIKSIYDQDRAYLPKRQMLRKDFPGLGINKRMS